MELAKMATVRWDRYYQQMQFDNHQWAVVELFAPLLHRNKSFADTALIQLLLSETVHVHPDEDLLDNVVKRLVCRQTTLINLKLQVFLSLIYPHQYLEFHKFLNQFDPKLL